jgi:AcrR family transcriptional regulator
VTAPPPETAGRRTASKADRREALLDAGLAALAKLGDDATVEDLAATMGVNRAPLYRYFGNRAGLYRALAARWVARALAGYGQAIEGDLPVADAVRAAIDGYLTLLEADKGTYLALSRLGHIADRSGDYHVMDYVETAGEAITTVLLRDLGGVDQEEARTWGQALAAMVHHVGDRWVRAPWTDRQQLGESLSRLVLHALEQKEASAETPR